MCLLYNQMMKRVTVLRNLAYSLIIFLAEGLSLKEIFIVVKTTRHYQDSRLPIILETWFQNAKKQIWFVTDIDNPRHQNLTNGHMYVTNCEATYSQEALCCKTGAEFNLFFKNNKKWFCHFDDDNYVNVHNLVKTLAKYNHRGDWYFGRYPLIERKVLSDRPFVSPFRYATLGAGCCISRGLALRIEPDGSGRNIIETCNFINQPDDVTLGFIIETRLKVQLIESKLFMSHYDNLAAIPPHVLKKVITVSYEKDNVISVPGFPKELDQTRFYSLHCYLKLTRNNKCLNETKELLMTRKKRENAKKGFWSRLFG